MKHIDQELLTLNKDLGFILTPRQLRLIKKMVIDYALAVIHDSDVQKECFEIMMETIITE